LLQEISENGLMNTEGQIGLGEVVEGTGVLLLVSKLGDSAEEALLQSAVKMARKADVFHYSFLMVPEDGNEAVFDPQGCEWHPYGDRVIPVPYEILQSFSLFFMEESSPPYRNLVSLIRGISTALMRQLFGNVDLTDLGHMSGPATFGIGVAKGEDALMRALGRALSESHLTAHDLWHSPWLILNFEVGEDFELEECDEALQVLWSFLGANCQVILSNSVSDTLGERRVVIFSQQGPKPKEEPSA